VRRRFRRARWVWLASSLLINCGWDAFDLFVLAPAHPFLGFLFDSMVIAISSIVLMLWISHHEEQRLMALEVLARARIEREHLAGQLEAVHVTARTVAHELNQPLAIIRGYAELVLETPSAEPIAHELAIIMQQADRAARLGRQLLQVTRYVTTPTPAGTMMLDLTTSGEPPPLWND
jgi:signal transduction histidine kinase